MTGNKCLLSNLNKSFRENVKHGNNSIIRVMGKENVQVLMNRKKENIGDVFYVLELKGNFISIGQLQEVGYAIVIQKGSCHIYDPEKEIIAEVKMSGNQMFPLLNEVIKDQIFLKSTIQDPSWLWHYKYGHLNFKDLKTLQIKNMVKGLPSIQAPSRICKE